MPKIIMMCGVSGSGKSTYARELAHKTGAAIVSTDEIRKNVFGDENDQTHNKAVFELAFDLISDYLDMGYDVIFDATNLRAIPRTDFCDLFGERAYLQIIVLDRSLDTCEKHQKERERKVPRSVLRRQYGTYEPPSLEEGWDMIMIDRERNGK